MRVLRFFTRSSTRSGVHMSVLILIVLGIVALVNVLVARHGKRFDLTETKRFSLSSQTKKVLANLDRDVTVFCFYKDIQAGSEAAEDLLDQYAYESPRFTYQFVDPDADPAVANKYKITSYGTIIVESGENREKITSTQEEHLTNAIVKVTREGKKVIYFTKGHGERDIFGRDERGYGLARNAIQDKNYEVKEVRLAHTEMVPEDCSVLVVPGPEVDFLDVEMTALAKYVEDGGRALFMIDPGQAESLAAFLSGYGAELGDDVIVDKVRNILGMTYYTLSPIIFRYGTHAITKDFSLDCRFPMARSIKLTKSTPGINVEMLAETEPSSWAETDMEMAIEENKASFDEGIDPVGPITVAAVITVEASAGPQDIGGDVESSGETEGTAEEQTTRRAAKLAVFGDSDFPDNINFQKLGNGDLFLNVVNWLAEEEDLIAIGPKPPRHTPVMLTDLQKVTIFLVPIVAMPGMVLLVGIGVFIYRRAKG